MTYPNRFDRWLSKQDLTVSSQIKLMHVRLPAYWNNVKQFFVISHTCSIIFSLRFIQNNSDPFPRCKHGRPNISNCSHQSFANNLHSHSCFRVWPRHSVVDYRYSSNYFFPIKKNLFYHPNELFRYGMYCISCLEHSFSKWRLNCCFHPLNRHWHFSDIYTIWFLKNYEEDPQKVPKNILGRRAR